MSSNTAVNCVSRIELFSTAIKDCLHSIRGTSDFSKTGLLLFGTLTWCEFLPKVWLPEYSPWYSLSVWGLRVAVCSCIINKKDRPLSIFFFPPSLPLFSFFCLSFISKSYMCYILAIICDFELLHTFVSPQRKCKGNQTQVLSLARQAFYQLSHSCSPL